MAQRQAESRLTMSVVNSLCPAEPGTLMAIVRLRVNCRSRVKTSSRYTAYGCPAGTTSAAEKFGRRSGPETLETSSGARKLPAVAKVAVPAPGSYLR